MTLLGFNPHLQPPIIFGHSLTTQNQSSLAEQIYASASLRKQNIPMTTATDQQTLGPSGRSILRLKTKTSEESPMPCHDASTPTGPSKKKLKAEARRIAAQQQLDWLRQKFRQSFDFNFCPLALNIREAIMTVARDENRSPKALCDAMRLDGTQAYPLHLQPSPARSR